ncbi:MAG: cation diffusion facilitator family transporter [Methylococcaceae bacterium]|nr:cation diffusion facilitator family transporter [Methylococcaceae bacterium]
MRLAVAGLITLGFVVFEAVAGLYANSLALLTDAAHNLTDTLALGLSWYAHRLASRPAHAGKTFGYHRAGILVALLNSSTLVLIAVAIFHEAWGRFSAPPAVASDMLMTVGGAAFTINLLTAWLVHHGSEQDLNLHSAFLHLMGDVFSTLGAIAAGLGIWLTGKQWLDPAASVLIGLLILWNAWTILRETLTILLEATPVDIDMSRMVLDFLQVEGVRGVHDLHVWSISRSIRLLSAHIVTDDISIAEGANIQRSLGMLMREKYGIDHSTLQLECEGCEPDLLYCDISKRHSPGLDGSVKQSHRGEDGKPGQYHSAEQGS